MTSNDITPGRVEPIIDELTRPFWNSSQAGRLVVQRLDETLLWPPRFNFCNGVAAEAEWQQVSGLGSVYTYSVIHRSSHALPSVPYILAVVELDEGLHMTSNIVDCSPEEVAIGMRVAVKFEPLGDIALPVFRPI